MPLMADQAVRLPPSPLNTTKKSPRISGGLGLRKEASLADFRGIAEGDREEEGGNPESKDKDVGKAFHEDTPGGQLRVVPAGGT